MTSERPGRLGALDLMRGATVAAMIVVNNPGNWNAVFPQLTHAAWNGVTFADLIFPAFIFIMGVAMALARQARGDETAGASPYRRILSRGLLLVVMGLALNAASAWPDLWSARVPGVLQRIGVTYTVAALIMANATRSQQWATAVGALLFHSALLALGGSLDPARNLGAGLDRLLFGAHTLTPTGDPEGVLGLLTSVATALFGAVAGRSIRYDAQRVGDGQRLGTGVRIALGGLVAIVVGYAWSFLLPMNKALWTGSFAVFSSGVSALTLAVCLALASGRAPRATAPLFWLGTNPLAVYFGSELTTTLLLQRPWLTLNGQALALKDMVYWRLIVPLFRDNGGEWSSLAYAASYALLWVGVAGVMRWRGVRLRL